MFIKKIFWWVNYLLKQVSRLRRNEVALWLPGKGLSYKSYVVQKALLLKGFTELLSLTLDVF